MPRYRPLPLLLAVALSTLYVVALIAQPHHEFLPPRWLSAVTVALLISWVWVIATSATTYIAERLTSQAQHTEQAQARAKGLMRAVGMDD